MVLMAAVNKIRKIVLSQLIKSNSFQNNHDITLQPSLSLFASRRGVASKLFVGGLSFYTSEKQLLEAFSQHGQVVEAKVVTDRVSARSKGFGFITFASEDEAETAKTEMDGKALDGRVVFVDYAKSRTNFGDGVLIARGPPDPTTEQ